MQEKQCRSHTMKFVGPHHYEITYQDKDFHFKWDEGPNGAVYVGTEECKRQRVSVAWFPAYKHHDLDIDFLEYVLGWSPRNVVIAGSALHAKLNGTDIAENLVAPLKVWHALSMLLARHGCFMSNQVEPAPWPWCKV